MTSAGPTPAAPVGVYACGCGDAHPLGASCPVALDVDREDLAREVARLWAAVRAQVGYDGVPGDLQADIELPRALDRLARAHGLT